MKSFEHLVLDRIGLHARPAGMLVRETEKYASEVVLKKDGKQADASKLMKLMSLGVKYGDVLTVEVSGEDEAEACERLEAFFKENL